MKILNRAIFWLFPCLLALALFRPFSGFALVDTNNFNNFSWLKVLPPGYWLDSWSFEETNWDSDFGFPALSFTNIEQAPDWDGNALQMDSTNAAWLTYNIVEDAPGYGEYTNLALNTGSIEFWFVANWESADTNFYGTGPGDWGRFIDVGTWTTNANNDWWSLYLNPSGTGIYFSSGTNGIRTNYLSAPISWDWNTWHLIVLTYSPTNTSLYLDGELAASGDGVRYVPSGDILTNGFAIGSDFTTGMQQAHGQFDDLYTYSYQLSADDIAYDYAEIYPELPGTFNPDDGFGPLGPPPLPGGGSGSGDSGGGGGGGFIPPVYDYGSSLWVAALGITNNALSLLATNTQADILYEIQETTNILSSWTSYGFIYGSELTNWTLAGAPVGNDGSTFYRIRSWQSIGGVPIWWWLTYFGQDTNVDGEAFSPSGDGWTLLQCYQNGFNPTNWVTPPAPQGLTITSYNTNGTASLNWMLSAGPVTGYIVQTPSGTNIVGSSVDSFTDSSSSDSATYSIQAIYAGGLSAWSPSVSVQDFENEITSPVSANNILSASIIGGPVGSAYLAVSAIPADTYELQVTRVDIVATYYHADASYNATFNIPISNPTNGFYLLTNSYMPPDAYVGEYPTYIEWYAQAIETNGTSSSFVPVGSSYTSTEDSNQASWTVPPFFDGRIQMKQDLIFLLRDPNEPAPFSYDTINGDSEIGFTLEPTNYAYAGIYNSGTVWNGYEMTPTDHSLDVYRPFEENYIYANFVFNSENVDSNGDMTTGASAIGNGENNLGPPFEEYDTLTLQVPATNQFQAPTTEGATIPSLLAASSTSWLFTYYGGEWGNYGNLNFGDLGVYTYFDGTSPFFYALTNGAQNFFGLPFLSDLIAYQSYDTEGEFTGNLETEVLNAGDNTTLWGIDFYPQTAQPVFQTIEYDFLGVASNSLSLPGDTNFSPTNASEEPLIASVGTVTNIACYAKLAVTNGYPGVYGYLGQYFTNAYQIDGSGNVTTNLAGMLSPYGQFFATDPGQAALVTMPDPDTGVQGTGVVDVISLNVDANHDGTMDFSFTGPDYVSVDNPYHFWVNDDIDWGDTTGDGIPGQGSKGDGMMQVLISSQVPYQLIPSSYGVWAIHGTRDLVDFFPVYVNIGSLFLSNALSAGIDYADTNWQFVLSQGDSALRFAYTDLTPTNYMNYLLDTNEATTLADFPTTTSPRLTTVTSDGVALSGDFVANIATNNGGIILVEAWTNTTRPLVLTIYHGTNQIAQTSLSLSISEVEQMFRHKNIMLQPEAGMVPDRTNDDQVPNEPPTNDKNFIFLHGYNVNPDQARGWDSDIFKRLYWSGSHAKFYGVTWEAADSQKFGAVTINLQTNIVNAFNTAPLLNAFLNSLSGTNIVAAHSLGNMLVLSTLNDCSNQNINTYFMIDAAVAIEAIDTSADSTSDMYQSAWTSYNGNLWASDWYGLFPANDYRSTLTWGGRLTNFQNAAVYNFYSSGEEVLRDYPGDPPPSLYAIAVGQLVSLWEGDTGLYTWAWQEKLKGLMPANLLLSSDHGGWQLNEDYETNITIGGSPYWEPMSPAAAAALTTTQLQTNAFFNFASGSSVSFDNDLALETSSGSSYAQANRNRILSDAIPCLTLPVGANPVPRLVSSNRNFDEQVSFENGWPADRNSADIYGEAAAGEWHHSDVRAVAYTFTYKLFNEMVTIGKLQ